ncbi:hypothetical protein MKW98_022634 [Papaver atlanticum]|uniref:Uncharacterized protein n=1 Tax=Papaver atlanticum TaxID=357466 RepID=A0AAD4T433_9MAGN|nr:hypothetical protein MKW98_022634 [Papaver atlanticum]
MRPEFGFKSAPGCFPIQVLCLFRFLWDGVIMTCFAYYFLLDTNRILVDEVWKQHWFWRRYFDDLDHQRSDVRRKMNLVLN